MAVREWKENIKEWIIEELFKLLIKNLTEEVIKGAIDKMFDYIEEKVAESGTELDDKYVLPIINAIRGALDIPDED